MGGGKGERDGGGAAARPPGGGGGHETRDRAARTQNGTTNERTPGHGAHGAGGGGGMRGRSWSGGQLVNGH